MVEKMRLLQSGQDFQKGGVTFESKAFMLECRRPATSIAHSFSLRCNHCVWETYCYLCYKNVQFGKNTFIIKMYNLEKKMHQQQWGEGPSPS